MNCMELIAGTCARGVGFMETLLADLSEADMMVRPVEGANHAAWQLGHLICGEAYMVGMVAPEVRYDLPEGWRQRFGKEQAGCDDAAAFASKREMLEVFSRTRARTVEWIRTLGEQDLARPTPESMRGYAPTVGALIMLLSSHVMMHAGQIQVIRRKLGKPVLF